MVRLAPLMRAVGNPVPPDVSQMILMITVIRLFCPLIISGSVRTFYLAKLLFNTLIVKTWSRCGDNGKYFLDVQSSLGKKV